MSEQNNTKEFIQGLVAEILEMNKNGNKPATLLEDELYDTKTEFSSLNSDLIAMDKKFNKKKHRKNGNRKNKKNWQNRDQTTNR